MITSAVTQQIPIMCATGFGNVTLLASMVNAPCETQGWAGANR